jgi:hypothetical protein
MFFDVSLCGLVIVPDVSTDFNAFIVRVIEFKKKCTSKFLAAVQLFDPEDEGASMI